MSENPEIDDKDSPSSSSPDPTREDYDASIFELEQSIRTKKRKHAFLQKKLAQIDRLLAETRAKRQRLEDEQAIQNLTANEIAQCYTIIGPMVKQINFIGSATGIPAVDELHRKKLQEAIREVYEEVDASLKYYKVLGGGGGGKSAGASTSTTMGKVSETQSKANTKPQELIDIDEYVPFTGGEAEGKPPGPDCDEDTLSVGSVVLESQGSVESSGIPSKTRKLEDAEGEDLDSQEYAIVNGAKPQVEIIELDDHEEDQGSSGNWEMEQERDPDRTCDEIQIISQEDVGDFHIEDD